MTRPTYKFGYNFTISTTQLQYKSCSAGKTDSGGVIMKEKKEETIVTDPFGSYTGLVKDPHEKPVQDADDL